MLADTDFRKSFHEETVSAGQRGAINSRHGATTRLSLSTSLSEWAVRVVCYNWGMYRDEALAIADGLIEQAKELEHQAKVLRSNASKLRHPHSLGNLPERASN